MDDLSFQFSDCETPIIIHSSFFEMGSPTLDDLSINNNNGDTIIFQQNHHFSLSNPNLANLSINNDGPHQNHHGQGHGSNFDPFENYHGGNNDQFENHHGIQQGQNSNGLSQFNKNNETFSHQMVEEQYDHQHNNFSFGGNNFEVDSSSKMNQNHLQTQPSIQIPVLLNQTEVQQLEQWPPTQLPYFCSCCQVLREIIHANGIQFEKLEIHGKIGLITHAIHHQTPVNGNPPIYQMIDFGRRSLDEIKNFLAQYCVERNLAGYFLLQDPMSPYYEALCTGLDWIEDLNMEDPVIDNNNQILNGVVGQEQVGENGASAEKKEKDLAEQRKRANKLTLSDLCDFFHLPIENAAERVQLCPTVVKKTCRKAGLARWPHRKVKSILKQIALLGSQLSTQDPVAMARTEHEINRLKQEMIDHCGGHVPTEMYNIAPFNQHQEQHQQHQ